MSPYKSPKAVAPDTVPEGFTHSLDDLVNVTNQKLIQKCKTAACIDKFLIKITEVFGAENMEKEFPSFKEIPEEHQEAFNRLKAELDADLSRMVPEEYDTATGHAAIDLSTFKGIQKQWKAWRKATKKGSETTGFSRSLLETAADLHHRQTDPEAPTDSTTSEEKTAFVDVCRKLKDVIEDQRGSATFACGGSIAIADGTRPLVSPPVRLYWDQDGNKYRLTLPESKGDTAVDTTIQELLQSSSPATFGRGKQDVLDPSYRQASKLEPTHFATPFHPADFGIIEAIQQALLPNINSDDQNQMGARQIVAELYMLNTYSGPSGLFRSHIDTPRSSSQVGSLVVCLPSHFAGGDLIVCHEGRTVTFDWDKLSASHIQWAAFYSDCEHEIKTITDGNRITLTYNLYVETQVLGEIISNPVLDPKRLPLYEHMKLLMKNENFMKDGGILGVFCSHAYAHTAASAQHALPRALKGSDLAFYSALKSLGVRVDVRPILETHWSYPAVNPDLGIHEKTRFDYLEPDHDFYGRIRDDDFYGNPDYDFYNHKSLEHFAGYLRSGTAILDINYASTFPDHYENWEDVDRRWKILLLRNRAIDLDRIEDEIGYKFNIPDSYFCFNRVRVGNRLHKHLEVSEGVYEGGSGEVADCEWPHMRLPGITWLTGPTKEEPAFTYIAEGNNPSIETCYSAAAILAVIPSFAQRTRDQGQTAEV